MSFQRPLLAAAMATMAMTAAQAQSSVTYVTNLGIEGESYFQVQTVVNPISGPFSTNGLLTAQGGPAAVSLSVVADPLTGMFKSLSRVQVSAGGTPGSGSVGSTFKLRDTLTFNGPEPSVTVTFTLNWDTQVSGLDAASELRYVEGQPFAPALMYAATQDLKFNEAAPPSDGGINPCNGEPFCEAGGGPPLTLPTPPTHEVYGWGFPTSEPGQTLYFGQRDGRYTGQKTVTFTVAAGSSFNLDYTADNSAQCFYVSHCDLTVDASHSDYLGMSLSEGATFSSAQGFQYLGVAAAVPEPAGWALALLGLGVVAARARRRPR